MNKDKDKNQIDMIPKLNIQENRDLGTVIEMLQYMIIK